MGKPRSAKGRGRETVSRLAQEYPEAACALAHDDPFQLLAATILSAQCTDEMVNKVTPALFARYPDAYALAEAEPEDVEALIMPTGFFRQKTKSLIGMSQALEEGFEAKVPDRLEDLVTLPGVGRKTANVVLGVWFGQPGITVDTHVGRLSRRLGLTVDTDPVKVELDLMAVWPRDLWTETSLRLILHGRQVCVARKPRCEVCVLNDFCPSAFRV